MSLEILNHEVLAHYSTFNIGGPADYFVRLKDTDDLPEALNFAKQKNIPYFVFGGGSNVLFADSGFRGLVIRVEAKNFKSFEDQKFWCEAGLTAAQFISESQKAGLEGAEAWVGLPGTIGGAVRGNAGSNGLETKDILVSATLFDPEHEQIHTRPVEYFNYAYRFSRLKSKPEIVLAATFQLKPQTHGFEELRAIMAEIRASRGHKQPLGSSGGSFFKNPSPEMTAGKLIDQAGLKGFQIGRAQISPVHGNFLQNLDKATQQDMIDLAHHAREVVAQKFAITLEEEVQILSSVGQISL